MSPSWNFPAQAELSYEGSEPSQAELGHLNFRAESELKKFFLAIFPKFLIIRFCLYIMFLKNFVIIY